MKQGFSARGLHPFPIRSFGGTVDQLSPATAVPEGNVLKSVNFRPHKDGVSRVKRMGYSPFDSFYAFNSEPIRGLFDYWDEGQNNRYVVITSKKIFSRAAGAGSWSELYSQASELGYPVKPVVFMRERPIVVGFDKNLMVEPTTVYGLGIEAPISAPTLAEGVAGNLTGTFKYVVTYMRSGNFMVESNPSPESSPITVSAKKIDLSVIPVSSDPKVDKKRIYRTTPGGAIFFWIDDIPNAQTTYTDDIASYGAQLSYDRLPPPVAVFAEVWDDRLWLVPKDYRNQLHFTNKGTSEEMANTNIVQVKGKDSDEIMAMGVYGDPSSLYILKRKKPYRIDKIGDSAYQMTPLPYNTGTDAPASVATGGGLLIWKSKKGIEVFNGETILRPPISDRLAVTMATINEASIAKAYGLINEKWDEYWLAVPTGSSTEPDLLIVFDFLTGKLSTFSFADKMTAMHNLRDAAAKLQFITGTSAGDLFIQDSTFLDNGSPINGAFQTGHFLCQADAKGTWNKLRRYFGEHLCPQGSRVTLNIYANQKNAPSVSLNLEGSTPSGGDPQRAVLMRRKNLGVDGVYFSLEYVHNEAVDGEVRIMPPELYFKNKVWKADVEAD